MKTMLTLILIALVSGCTSVRYNPDTKEVEYISLGVRSIDRLEMVKDGDDVLIDLNGYQKETPGDFLDKLIELAREVK